MTINWVDIEKNIENSKTPLLLFFIVVKNKNNIFNDEDMSIFIRYYLKYHNNIMLDYNFLKFSNYIVDYPLSLNVLKDFYCIQFNLLKHYTKIDKYKKMFPKTALYKCSNKYEYLAKVKQRFMAYNDCCNGNLYFHIRIKVLSKALDKNKFANENDDEIISRLRGIYLLFGQQFFINNNILLLSSDDYVEMSIHAKYNYVEYLFLTISKILDKLLDYYEYIYDNEQLLENLLNPKIINVDINSFTSSEDIEYDF